VATSILKPPDQRVQRHIIRARYWQCLGGWEYRCFLAGTLAVVLHLLDGGVVQRAPGTGVGDHIVSHGLPAALVVLAMLSWPPLGPALRAVVALALGVLATGAGLVTHGTNALAAGMTATDVTGLVMVGGGVLLCGVGVVTTARTMREPARRDLRWFGRRLLVVGAGLAVTYYILVPVLVAVYATHPRQANVARVDLGVSYEDVTFLTSDGLRLVGWFIPSRNGATIIAVPGAGNDRTGVADHAAMLARHGYGVLLFDPRGTGQSEGDPNHFGWHTEKDIRAALTYLRGRPDVDPTRIGALGLSMGAEAVLQAAAQNAAIRAVAAEGAGARNLDDVLLQSGVGKWVGLPQTWLTYTLAGVRSRVAPPPSLKELVPRIAPRPLLVMYASGSQQAGEAQLNAIYYAAAGEPKEVWAIPDAGHTKGLATHPSAYESRVIGFFDRALVGRAE
jgi:fermentation-respiration switch protein FrsA (DUF1100 family)